MFCNKTDGKAFLVTGVITISTDKPIHGEKKTKLNDTAQK